MCSVGFASYIKSGLSMTRRSLSLVLTLVFWVSSASAATCPVDDYEVHISGVSQCLLMRRYGSLEPSAMVIWLHGDVSSGGPADYQFAFAEVAADNFSSLNVLSIALVRPGYPDGTGESSSVSFFNSGRSDHYTRENIEEVGAAIEHLRNHFKPKTVVLVGHSGGAATAAVLMEMKPGLAEDVVLISCPCDLVAWRTGGGRKEWSRSENPIKWIPRVNKSTRVIALTGSRDDNTYPELARAYVDALKAQGNEAVFQTLPAQTHNGAFQSGYVFDALRQLLDTPQKVP